MFGCHKCKWRDDPNRLERCIDCTAATEKSGEGMKVGHATTVSIDAAENPELVMRYARLDDPHHSRSVTGLPDDVEDTLRSLLATVVGLDDYDILLLVNLARGYSFADAARRIEVKAPNSCLGNDKRIAHRRFADVCREFAPFEALVKRIRPSAPKTPPPPVGVQLELFSV